METVSQRVIEPLSSLNKDMPDSNWVKWWKTWEAFTNLSDEKQRPAIILTLSV